ncbi:MAG: CoA-binding protein [Candidatus Pacearchaeota archaeon]|nr:CoA-binding protein [Candidatus Pacearchaeota archaeon]
MKEFFDSKKIAVIGTSRDEKKVGHIIFKNLLENKDLKVFPVNPNADSVLGQKCFDSVLGIPFIVDLAIIAIPNAKALEAIEECGKKNIKNIVLITAGFAESNNRELNEKLKKLIEKYKLNLLGPNVLGVINPYKNLNASFFKGMPEKGNIAFISQSGALGTAILDKCLEENLGISAFIPLGNMLQQDFLAALEYLANDMRTEVICLYVESLKDNTGKRFIELCQEISKKKKILVLKSGKTEKGLLASKSHTASLASDSAIYSSAFKQAGVIEVSSLEELFLASKVISKYPKLGNKACIVTNAGGLGILATDALTSSGIKLIDIPEVILKQLDTFVPQGYSRRNPLDIMGDALAGRYEKTIRIINMYKLADFFVVILSPQEMTQPLETLQAMLKFLCPIFLCYIGGKFFSKAKEAMKSKLVNFDDVSKLAVLGKLINNS